jgi:hypothetical protein
MAHRLDETAVTLVTVGWIVSLALVAAMVGASPAHAGYWMRSSCIIPGGAPASSEGWSAQSAGVGYGSTNSVACTPSSPMFAYLSAAEPASFGAHETLVYTAPEGSTLSGGTVVVDLLADGGGANASGVAVVYSPSFAYDTSNVVMQCAWGLGPCANGTNHYAGPVTLPANAGGSLYVSASCGGRSGSTCDSGGSEGVWSRVLVHYAYLLLSSSHAPVASDFSGTLLSPDAHGTATLSFAAEVPGGPGIYKVVATIDGKPVYDATPNTNGGRCAALATDRATGALLFGYQQPCLRALTVDLTVRTTTLRDGAHELVIVVTDAAQNSQTVLRQPITINNRTTASSTLTSDPPESSAGPSPAAPGAAPAAVDAVYKVALDAGTQRLTRGVRNVWALSGLKLSGTLQSPPGETAAGVAVTLFARSALDFGPRAVARTTTDAAGRWTLRAPRGPSRTLTITWGARPDPTSSLAIRIRQTVRPRISLRVEALGRGKVRFSGRLRFEPLEHPRPLIAIQTLNANRHWGNVATLLRVGPSGAYSVIYDGEPNTIGGNYAFRTIAHSTALFSTGVSPIRRALVL